MDRLTIHAISPESGRALLAALSDFQTELVESAEGCDVVVTLGPANSEVVAVLNALEQYVHERGDGPARFEFYGRNYVMHSK